MMPWLRNVRYWIPCFVGGILCLFTAIFMIFRAPETLSREQAKQAKLDKKKNAESYMRTVSKVYTLMAYFFEPLSPLQPPTHFFSHGWSTTVSPLSLDGSWATPDAMRCKSYGSRFRHHFLSIRPLGKDRPPFLPFGLYT